MASTIWKGHLTFGLVSLPVKLFAAARAETIGFNQLHRTDHSRIKMKIFCAAEDVELSRADIVKGYEYEKDRYVVIDDEDIKKMAPRTARVMEVLEFVKAVDVDPTYYEKSYYMAPEEAGEKPYALLFESLKRSGYVALAKIAMHNREHIVILRPSHQGLTLHTMYFEDELRQTEAFRTDTSLVKEKELEMAMMLVEALAAGFEPAKYKDNYRENLKAMIEAKIAGSEVVAPVEAQQVKVIDIMDALKASLASLKKPAETESTTAAAKPRLRKSGTA
ncbi:MAG: Ku protein [Candidatus Solibacter usitatus]|nr:Ku protein [Candidatus Solibacter usitatus]